MLGGSVENARYTQTKGTGPMTIEMLQWPGALLGLIGAVLVAQKSMASRRWGFVLWILSNACLVVFAVAVGAWALVGMYACYAATSAWGWKNNRAL